MAQREGSRTPHEGTVEFISLDSHKGAGESLTQASKAQLELLLWQCSLELGLPAGMLLLPSRHLPASRTKLLFGLFTLASFWAAVLGFARSLGDCSKRRRDVPAPSGALATAGMRGIENRAALCWLSRDLFQARLDPCPKQICSRLCSDLEAMRAGKAFKLASSSPGGDVTVLSHCSDWANPPPEAGR